ncbi:MAG: hypothetical protein EBX50_23615, partial [Chitinophagia bacterium]|nr:hypothetical protein [Chitinophagia bacterium]
LPGVQGNGKGNVGIVAYNVFGGGNGDGSVVLGSDDIKSGTGVAPIGKKILSRDEKIGSQGVFAFQGKNIGVAIAAGSDFVVSGNFGGGTDSESIIQNCIWGVVFNHIDPRGNIERGSSVGLQVQGHGWKIRVGRLFNQNGDLLTVGGKTKKDGTVAMALNGFGGYEPKQGIFLSKRGIVGQQENGKEKKSLKINNSRHRRFY